MIPEFGARLGVMVSASHNPAPDNGVKFFDSLGGKLDDSEEARIEARLREGGPWKAPTGGGIGRRTSLRDSVDRYLAAIRRDAGVHLDGLRLAVDCANGAAYRAAPELFTSLGADVAGFYTAPDGVNINDGCGATVPEKLGSVAEGRIGLCFDGDADRLIVIDEDGRVANGDAIMAIIARHLKAKKELPNNRVVSTVMSNLGFRKAMHEAGIDLIETQVGDRYVMKEMVRRGAMLGGEQSGHVIQLDKARTGDGLRTALRLLEVVTETARPVTELRKEALVEFPQVLRNVAVRSKDVAGNRSLQQAIREMEGELGDDGRILVRASGTEPVVRVMAEAPDLKTAHSVVQHLVGVVADQLG